MTPGSFSDVVNAYVSKDGSFGRRGSTDVASPEELAALLGHVRSKLVKLSEELLSGLEVTLEGYVHEGRLTTIGVTDSLKYPGTNSFERFEYPTALGAERQAELSGVATRVLPALGFDGGFFNMEFFVPETGPARIIEVNGRMASQFAPLVRAVHGVSSYEIQLDLVSGGSPELPPARDDLVASSFVLRTYQDAIVEAVPDPAAVLERFPHAQVELLVRPGQRLSENDHDVASHRLALVALAAPTREAVLARYEETKRLLTFDLRPISPDRGRARAVIPSGIE